MQASNKPVIWSIVIATAVMLIFGSFGFSNLNSQNELQDEKIDNMKFPTALEIADAVVLPEMPVTESDKIDQMYEDMFETDFWESEAEVLALEEIEDDNYEVLYDFMVGNDSGELNLSIDDEKDIDSVIVKDVTVTSPDVDDRDATVEYDLKVYYENSDGDNKKVYLTVTVVIEDNDVEYVYVEESD